MTSATLPRARRVALACLCLFIATTAGGTAARAGSDGVKVMLAQLNAVRAQRGLRPLAPDPRLMRAAQRESEALARLGRLTHVGPDGDLGTRVRRAGYRYRLVEENLAAGIADPVDVLTAWLHSPPHRANLLRAEVSTIGIGYAPQGAAFGHYWTLILAGPAI